MQFVSEVICAFKCLFFSTRDFNVCMQVKRLEYCSDTSLSSDESQDKTEEESTVRDRGKMERARPKARVLQHWTHNQM